MAGSVTLFSIITQTNYDKLLYLLAYRLQHSRYLAIKCSYNFPNHRILLALMYIEIRHTMSVTVTNKRTNKHVRDEKRERVAFHFLRACWFIRSLVCWFRSFVTLVICHRRSTSVLNFTGNFSEVKVKVQGQNRRIENLPLLIAWLSFEISSPNLAIRQMSDDRSA